jgi:AcrR family transcriptional regulator
MAIKDHPQIRERALIVASRLLRERGYDGTRMEDVATELSVTPPALYWHFPSKADLFYELIQRIIDRFNAALDEARQGDQDPGSLLRRTVEAHTLVQLEGIESSQAYSQISFAHPQVAAWMSDDQADSLRRQVRQYFRNMEELIQRGLSAGVFRDCDPTVAAFAILNISEFAHLWFRPGRSLSAAQVAKMHGEFALRIVRWAPQEKDTNK